MPCDLLPELERLIARREKVSGEERAAVEEKY